MAYPGIYKAKAVSVNGTKLAAFIPQVFGDVSVTVENFVGSIPSTGQMGWVSFQGGNPEFPVWHGGGGGAGTVSDVVWVDPTEPNASMELWYDTDEEVPLDPRYVSVAGDALEGDLYLGTTNIHTAFMPTHANHLARKGYVDAELASPWIALPYAAGWADYNATTYSNGGYRKIGDTVYLRGLITKPSTPVSTICTLPAGYRPPKQTLLSSMISGNGGVVRAAVRLDLSSGGVLSFGSVAMPTHLSSVPTLTVIDHLTLDGLNFSVTP